MVSYLSRLRKNDNAGVATYALVMFGLVFMLYLFGFTSMWDQYQDISGGPETPVTSGNDAVNFGVNIFDVLTQTIQGQVVLGSTLLAAVGLFITTKVLGGQTTATILQYIIPILLLVALNIFIFPISGISADIGFMDATGTVITLFLFAFFNIFFILAVLEFIRGNI